MCRALRLALLVLFLASPAAAGPIIHDAVNAGYAPSAFFWNGVSEVGWFYTPADDYWLVSIHSRFYPGVAAGTPFVRPVTAEIYLSDPFLGGARLRSLTTNEWFNDYWGGFTPLGLTAGHAYFIGFRNVEGIGINFTNEADAETLGPMFWSPDNHGLYRFYTWDNPPFRYEAPIIEFFADSRSGIPEPGAFALLGVGVLGVLRRAWRVQRAKRRQPF